MPSYRETFFECSFTSGYGRRTAHVRAWSAAEAERMFREDLAEEGVDAAGTIVVAGGHERRSSRVARKTAAH